MGRALTMPRKFRLRKTIKRVLLFTALCFALQPLYSLIRPAPRLDSISGPHPIRARIATATKRWREKVERQSQTYDQFKEEYQRRYQLDPPEGMETWFRRVRENGHVLVDEYDEMMRSLEPFRIMGGEEVKRRTLEIAQLPTFSLLNVTWNHSYFYGQDYRGSGRPYSREDYGPGLERVEGLAAMLQPNIDYIPDGTIFAVSELAEPRVIVPWQDRPTTLAQFSALLDSPIKEAHSPADHLFASPNSHGAFSLSSLKRPNASDLLPTPNFRGEGSSWELYARSCPPESPARKHVLSLKAHSAAPSHRQARSLAARNLGVLNATSEAKVTHTKRRWPAAPSAGFESGLGVEVGKPLLEAELAGSSPAKSFGSAAEAKNSTNFEFLGNGFSGLSHEALCKDSNLHQLQGAFYSDWRGLPALYPVFSPSKIDGFSDILIPSNFYYGDDARYSLDEDSTIPWEAKNGKLFWRGATTGGGNSPPRHQLQYQRHRFIRMAQSLSRKVQSLLLPSTQVDSLTHVKRPVGDLNQGWFDVGFTSYTGCGDPDVCDITRNLFPLKDKVQLADMAKYKAILDLDGMAFSGRFVALMGMGSGIFKSSIYRDFASDWIEPWLHYVPISPGYEELYNLLAYFLPLPEQMDAKSPSATQTLLRRLKGESSQSEGDKALRHVARAGVEWRDAISNAADIEAYTYRLALEWARILNTPAEGSSDIVYHFSEDS